MWVSMYLLFCMRLWAVCGQYELNQLIETRNDMLPCGCQRGLNMVIVPSKLLCRNAAFRGWNTNSLNPVVEDSVVAMVNSVHVSFQHSRSTETFFRKVQHFMGTVGQRSLKLKLEGRHEWCVSFILSLTDKQLITTFITEF